MKLYKLSWSEDIGGLTGISVGRVDFLRILSLFCSAQITLENLNAYGQTG